MKVYISVPIYKHCIGKCMDRAARNKHFVEQRGHQAVTPFDVCDASMKHSQCIGRCVETLVGCDAVLQLSGWSSSRGCQLEWRCAEVYGKKVYRSVNSIPKDSL